MIRSVLPKMLLDVNQEVDVEEIVFSKRTENGLCYRDGEVPYFYFPRLEKLGGFIHGCATRNGGVSEGVFTSMNLSFDRNDDSKKVMENYQRIGSAVGFDVHKLVLPKQVHETVVRKATKEDFGKGIFEKQDYTSVDAQITNVPGLCLAVFGADCVPVLLVDPVHKAIGTAHAGWRGSIARIAAKTVEAMSREFASVPSQILAFIGPSICGDCYEVGEDVAGIFKSRYPQCLTESTTKAGKYGLDLWKANEQVLFEAGVLKENITSGGVCTMCNPEFFFSHRRMGNARGNLACFLAIRE